MITLTHKTPTKNPFRVVLTVNHEDRPIYTDNLDISKQTARAQFIEKVSESFPAVDVDVLAEKMLAMANSTEKAPEPDNNIETPLKTSAKMLEETEPELIRAATDFLNEPTLIDMTLGHIAKMGLVGEKENALALYLMGVSRLLDEPIAIEFMGSSSSGKSYTIKVAMKLFPDEVILKAHRLSPMALAYMPEGQLEHRIVWCGERSRKTDDENSDSTRMFREMVSDGELRNAVAGKDEKGRMVTHYVVRKGPIAFCESTTLGRNEIFSEDATRLWFLCADESESQTRAVMRSAANIAKSGYDPELTDSLVALHHTIQRMLKRYDVRIPFADELIAAIPAKRPEARRSFNHLLAAIKASALLHQHQRTKGDGWLLADVDDYEVIRQHLTACVGRGLGVTLSAGADDLLEFLNGHSEYRTGSEFTASGIKEGMSIGRIVYDRLKELRSHGYLDIEPGAGNQGAKYRLKAVPDAPDTFELPSLKKSVCTVSPAHTHANSQGVI